jgi:hypothetical protein
VAHPGYRFWVGAAFRKYLIDLGSAEKTALNVSSLDI